MNIVFCKFYLRLLSLLALFIVSSFSLFTYGQITFTSNGIGGGDWNLGTTWDQTSCSSSCVEGVDFPGPADSVIIQGGDSINVVSTHSCYDLTQNIDASGNCEFIVGLYDTLQVLHRWSLNSAVSSCNANITIDGIVEVGDRFQVLFNDGDGRAEFNIGDVGFLNLKYSSGNNNVFALGSNDSIIFNQDGVLNVDNNIVLNASSNSNISFFSNDSLLVNNRITLSQSGSGATVLLAIQDTAYINDILFNLGSANTANLEIDLTSSFSALALLGDISMVGGGGTMDASSDTSYFVLAGSSAQSIPVTPTMTYHDIIILNQSTGGVSLSGDITTSNVLGNIIINDGATLKTNGYDMHFGGSIIGVGTGNIEMTSGDTLNFIANNDSLLVSGNLEFTEQVIVSGLKGLKVDGMSNVSFNHLTIDTLSFIDFESSTEILGNLTSYGTIEPYSDTLFFEGNAVQTIQGEITFSDVVINNSMGVQLLSGGDSIVFGDLTITSAAILDPDAHNFVVSGNWMNEAGATGFTPDSAQWVSFKGGNAQSISGTDTTIFKNILIKNTNISSPWVTINDPVIFEGVLDVDDGQLNANGNLIMAINSYKDMAVLGNLNDANEENPPIINSLLYQRLVTEDAGAHWYLLASPLTGTQLEDWDDDTYTSGITGSDSASYSFVSMSTWDESACDFNTPSNMTDGHNNGLDESGWFVYANTGEIFDLEGEPRTGTVTIGGLTSTGACSDATRSWHLLGNPYAAHVYWDSVNVTNIVGASGGSAYILKNDNSGDYVELDHNTMGDIISSGEAFWVQVSDLSTGTVEFEESDKTESTSDNYNTVKLVGGVKEAVLQISMLSDGYRADQTKIAIRENASEGFEWYNETSKVGNFKNYLNMATLVDNRKCSWNSIPDDVQNIRIPIVFYRGFGPQGSDHSITLTFNNLNEFLSYNKCVFFEDSLQGEIIQLTYEGQQISIGTNDGGDRRFFLNVSSPLTLSKQDPVCDNSSDGWAVAMGAGSGPFSYVWLNQEGDTIQQSSNIWSPDTLNGVASGIYTVMVDGNESCGKVTGKVELNAALHPSIVSIHKTNASCLGSNDGIAYAQIQEGNSGFSFQWSNGSMDTLATNLISGNYTLTVTDVNGCMVEKDFNIEDGEDNILSKTVYSVSCNGSNDGVVSITPVDNVEDYLVQWSTGDNTFQVQDLASGTYTVSITNEVSGCFQIDTTIIGEPLPIEVEENIQHVACKGDNTGAIALNLIGGTPPYNVIWAWNNINAQVADSLTSGLHSVYITDNRNCLKVLDFEVLEPEEYLTANFEVEMDTVLVNEQVAFTNLCSGEDTYLWNFGDGGTSNFENPNYSYSIAGSFEVELIAFNDFGCEENASKNLLVQELNLNANSPKPSDPLNILQFDHYLMVTSQFKEPTDVSINLYTTSGQRVFTSALKMMNNSYKLSLPTANGVYLLNIIYNNSVITRQLIR